MIDSFPFESWYEGDTFNAELGSYWPYVGDESGAAYGITSASAGTWVLTILGMLSVLFAFIGWFWYESRRISEAAERIRATGRWVGRPGADYLEEPPPAGPGLSER